jgi:hypothetical protein
MENVNRTPRTQNWDAIENPTIIHALAVLVHATEVGTDPDALSKRTGLPLPIVQEMVGRLRSAGYWTGDTVDASAWGDEARDMDGKLIWLQALVATGRASRIPQEAGQASEGGEVADPEPGAPTSGTEPTPSPNPPEQPEELDGNTATDNARDH